MQHDDVEVPFNFSGCAPGQKYHEGYSSLLFMEDIRGSVIASSSEEMFRH